MNYVYDKHSLSVDFTDFGKFLGTTRCAFTTHCAFVSLYSLSFRERATKTMKLAVTCNIFLVYNLTKPHFNNAKATHTLRDLHGAIQGLLSLMLTTTK